MSLKISNHPKTKEPPTKLSLQERMKLASDCYRQAKARNEEKIHNAKVLPIRTVIQRWADACRKYFPETEMPLIPVKASYALKAAMARHSNTQSSVKFLDLMDWSIEHWLLIMDTEFFGMDNKPMYPAVMLFVKCIGKFQNAWSEKEKLIAVSKMTTREQMVYHLMRKGRSQETAEREVDERLGLTKLRNDIASERAKLQRLQTNSVEHELLLSRIRMMDRTVERKQIRAVKGVGGTFEQWT